MRLPRSGMYWVAVSLMDWVEAFKVQHFGVCCSTTIILSGCYKSWWLQRDTFTVTTMFESI
jgi:hypothetical protein